MNRLDEQYRGILAELLYNGKEKGDRTGTGTLSKFGMQIRHKMSDGFPLLTTKKMAVKTMVTELKWFLKGDTNIKYLQDNNCKIWDGDYKKSGRTDGELGPIYGKQWRNWSGNDQIANLITELKTNPNSRRLMVSAWNVDELDQMTLPPCHYGFQVYTRELSLPEREKLCSNLGATWDLPFTEKVANKWNVPKRGISLMWNQRSVDTFLGLPFNIASYGMLLMLLCEETGYEPGDLIGNLGDTHLYNNHIEQAKEQVSRDGFDLPTIKLSNVDILNGEFDYELINYTSATAIKAPISN